MTDPEDQELQAFRERAAEQDQEIQALRERYAELKRRNAELERELAAFLAKLSADQRARVEAEWAAEDAERDPATPLH